MMRIDHCRDWLTTRSDGTSKLKVLRDTMPNFENEINIYHKKRLPDGSVEEKPDPRRLNHMMDCFGYISAHEPEWHPTKAAVRVESKALRAFKAFMKRGNKDKSDTVVFS